MIELLGSGEVGRRRRQARMMPSGRMVLAPLDDSLLAGPILGLENMAEKVRRICSAGPDAVMGFTGVLTHHHRVIGSIPTILNISASTTRSTHTRKVPFGTVERAIRLGADAVGFHVNVGSRYESEMLTELGSIAEECDVFGVPLLAIMYPRSEGDQGDDNYLNLKRASPDEYTALVAHATRIGAEAGASLIKTQYTGTPASFEKVVLAADGVPVVVAGGPVAPIEQALKIAEEAMAGGASGISFGRNVFGRENPEGIIAGIRAIVHEGRTAREAIEMTVGAGR